MAEWDMAVTCPVCRIEMVPVSTLGVALDRCPSCAGIWFDDGELATLAAAAPDALELLDSEHAPAIEQLNVAGNLKRCPNCSTQLESYRYAYDSPAVLDSCPKCHGIFVEDQELVAITRLMKDQPKSRKSALMAARTRLTGGAAGGGGDSERDIAALVHALGHWGHHTNTSPQGP